MATRRTPPTGASEPASLSPLEIRGIRFDEGRGAIEGEFATVDENAADQTIELDYVIHDPFNDGMFRAFPWFHYGPALSRKSTNAPMVECHCCASGGLTSETAWIPIDELLHPETGKTLLPSVWDASLFTDDNPNRDHVFLVDMPPPVVAPKFGDPPSEVTLYETWLDGRLEHFAETVARVAESAMRVLASHIPRLQLCAVSESGGRLRLAVAPERGRFLTSAESSKLADWARHFPPECAREARRRISAGRCCDGDVQTALYEAWDELQGRAVTMTKAASRLPLHEL